MTMTNKEAIKLIQGIEEDGWNVTSKHLEALDLAIKALEERPQGEWIEKVETKQVGYGWLTSHKIVCSVCDGSGEDDEGIPQNWKYCPNCGADMRGGNTNE